MALSLIPLFIFVFEFAFFIRARFNCQANCTRNFYKDKTTIYSWQTYTITQTHTHFYEFQKAFAQARFTHAYNKHATENFWIQSLFYLMLLNDLIKNFQAFFFPQMIHLYKKQLLAAISLGLIYLKKKRKNLPITLKDICTTTNY